MVMYVILIIFLVFSQVYIFSVPADCTKLLFYYLFLINFIFDSYQLVTAFSDYQVCKMWLVYSDILVRFYLARSP